MKLALALAGVPERVISIYPSANSDLKWMSDDSEGDRWARWVAVRRQRTAEQAHAMRPAIGGCKHPRRAQPQLGHEEAREALLGGLGVGGSSALQLWARAPQSGGASSSGAAWAVAPAPPLAPGDVSA